ncbi:hypothetical protein ACWOFR_17750 [Carnobacterium gallinarum]|uniref:hypothetical protein n=1 Tax=Carnobacterium gallinarum TaxID=2749 RepID=UPI00055617A8|nr:hypothetical protein [Carnobacterium gallinarum]
MEDGKNESGFVLLYVLGAIILISVMIGGIFLLARTVFFQVNKVDQFKRVQQVEEYAMQDGTNQIQKKIEGYISELETIDFGNDISKLSVDMDKLFNDFLMSEKDIGSDHQFSYVVRIEEINKEKVNPYRLTDSSGNFGWKEDPSVANQTKATNAQLSFVIEVDVTEKENSGKKVKSSATANYVYQIQWNDVDVEESVTEMDVWRNVVYSHYIPNSARYLSADSWMRKMDDVYRYNENHSSFGYSKFDNHTAQVFGYSNNTVVDITDDTFLDFSSKGKPLYSTLTFEGSLLMEHGISFEGNHSASQLITGNILSLRASDSKENVIQNLNVSAGNGTYIDLFGSSKFLAINEKDKSFQTSGLLINNTNSATNASSEGVLFGSGKLLVETQEKAREFRFANYASNALTSTPQDDLWNEFIKGSMVIASSNFYAGAFNLGRDLQAAENDQRQIAVDGNLLLTNAMLDSNTGQDGFSYFQEEELYSKPNASSILSLNGSNTRLTVDGMTFIDAPKTDRRKSIAEQSGETAKYYGDKEDWNTVSLKNGAALNLGYTGTEPFNLILGKDSILSLNVLPNLAYFDTTFLVNSLNEGDLNGKVILRVFNQTDMNLLESELKSRRIPVTVQLTEDAVQNGEVTIIKPDNPTGSDTSQMITRTFSYVEEVNH